MIRSKILSVCTLFLSLSSLSLEAGAQRATAATYPSDPYIVTAPTTAYVKVGSPATFTAVAWGATTLQYQWYRNGNLIAGATAAKYTTPATTDADNGSSFQVKVSDTAGSVNSSYAALYVVDSAPVMRMQPASQTVTAPGVAIFQANASDSNYNDITAQWYKNGKAVGSVQQGGWTSYSTEETNTADNGARFTVKFTNAAGSVTSNAAVLTVNPANTSGTYPIVGEWTGKATVTHPDGTVETVPALAAFSQNSYSLTGTYVFTDDEDDGIPTYGVGVASLNNLNVYAGAQESSNVAGVFSTDLLTFTGLGGGPGDRGEPESGNGKLTLSSDHNTLSGSATLSEGTKISWSLKRTK